MANMAPSFNSSTRQHIASVLDALHLRDQARFAKAVGSLLRGGRLREEIRAKRALTDPSALPNPWLLYLSQGTLSGLDYHEGGRATADYIRRQFADAGLRLTPDSRLFGLRMRRWADSAMVKDQAAKGCDCNPDFVAWCDANLPGVQTALNGAAPPTTYPLDTFDALYAQSVLTHLTPPQQAALMTEWARIVRPDGLILATFLG